MIYIEIPSRCWWMLGGRVKANALQLPPDSITMFNRTIKTRQVHSKNFVVSHQQHATACTRPVCLSDWDSARVSCSVIEATGLSAGRGPIVHSPALSKHARV